MPNLNIRDRLDAGRPVFGTFLKINAPVLVELTAMAGFDFVIIDVEHCCFTHEQIEMLIRTAELAGIGAVVRTPDAGETGILHALDSGASGVQVPSVRTVDEARAAVRHARHHPLGERGFARANRSARYGAMPLSDYFRDANRTLLTIHVENAAMVDAIGALCAVPSIDVLFLGAADLSQSLGVPGEQDHPAVRRALDTVIDHALAAGRHVGAVASNADEAEALIARGIRYIAWQSDIAILRAALDGAARQFRGLR